MKVWNYTKEIANLRALVTNFAGPKICNPSLRDASLRDLGPVLEQKYNKHWHHAAFTSQSLSKSEQNGCQLEK